MRIYPAAAEEKLGFDLLRARLMQRARHEPGRERLASMCPLPDRPAVEERLAAVSEWQRALASEEDTIPLHQVVDVRQPLRRVRPEGAYISPAELLDVARMLQTLRRVRRFFDRRREAYPTLFELSREIAERKHLEERIDEVVEGEGTIRDQASPELARIRRTIVRRQAQLRETLQSELRKAIGQGYATEEQPTIRGGRMVIPVRAEAKRKVEGFVQDVSATGQTVYIEPTACLNLNNEVRELQSAEQQEIERILRELADRLREHMDALQGNTEVLVQLDVLQAMASLARELDAVVPEIADEPVVDIRQGRHPVLQLHFKTLNERKGASGERTVVPLDLELGEEYQTLVVTGPNAGGKTVAMKTVGLFALMLAYGLPVPAAETSRFGLFDRLLVDIGDEQSIEEDLSTFSSHVARLKYMLRKADAHSLILIDEAGTGTDPAEGGALAQAVLEELTERGVRTIATTHHGTLKVFAHATEGVENGSMEFDQETLRPTYRFQAGLPGSSYAFDIARRMGLSGGTLERARELMGEHKTAMEELITEYEVRTQELDRQLAEARREVKDAAKERRQYEERRRRIDKEREEIRQQALEEAERIVKGANARIERTIREIKEAEAERERTKEARERFEEFREQVGRQADQAGPPDQEPEEEKADAPSPQEAAPAPEPAGGAIEEGDRVVLDEGTTAADVLEVNGGEAVLAMGAMRTRVSLDRLRKVGGKRKQKVTVRQTSSGGPGDGLPSMQARRKVDLRGYRVDEAISEVQRLIDRAVAANLNRVEILHGKGTGALRQAVQEHLATRPDVSHFEEAPWDQGGAGVTIVVLG